MDEAQFAKVVEQYERLVYTVCYQLVKSHDTAQDLSQETFLSAWRHLDSCPPESLKSWLARIAANKAKDHLKSAYNRRVQMPASGELPENGVVLFQKDQRVEEKAEMAEGLSEIEKTIRALKEPYHKVAVLYFLQEKSVEEIAVCLERPVKTVHTQLFRARRQLQEHLKGGP